METTVIRDYISGIRAGLGCSQRIVANLLGVDPHTISNNNERPISEVTDRLRTRVEALYYVVVKHLATVSPAARYRIINAHVAKDLEGNIDSVVSALQQDKYKLETLCHIAVMSWNALRADEIKDSLQVSDETQLSLATSPFAQTHA